MLSIPAQSKEPKYRGLFNLSSDPKHYQYVGYKSSRQFYYALLLKIVDKRPSQEKVFNENVQYFSDDVWSEPPIKMLGKSS